MIEPNVILEINNYIIRPLISPKGLYNCVIFLNILKFTSFETEASRLLKQLISYHKSLIFYIKQQIQKIIKIIINQPSIVII